MTNDTVIIGVGSCENHGMHMPLGTDALVPDKLISLVEERVQVLCAPMVPFGSCEYFSDFPGTVSLGDEVLYQVLFHIAEGLYRAGGRHFVFMNGHGGNIPAIERVCYGLSKKGAIGAVMNWWSMAGSFDPAWAGGHGGGEETAAILYINPDLVDRTAMKPGDIADVSEGIRAITLKNAEFRGVQIPIPRDARKICDNGWVGADDIMTATPQWADHHRRLHRGLYPGVREGAAALTATHALKGSKRDRKLSPGALRAPPVPPCCPSAGRGKGT